MRYSNLFYNKSTLYRVVESGIIYTSIKKGREVFNYSNKSISKRCKSFDFSDLHSFLLKL